MKTVGLGALGFGLCLIAMHPVTASVDAGRALAQEACSACHQVVPDQHRPPPVANADESTKVQAPSFPEVAQLCLSESDLRAKITSPHYPMREQVLSDIDVGSLAQYIRSLAPGSSCRMR